MDELEKYFQNENNLTLNREESWQKISGSLKKRAVIKQTFLYLLIILTVFLTYQNFFIKRSYDLYSDEKLLTVIELEQQLIDAIQNLDYDSAKVIKDDRSIALLNEIKEIDNRISRCLYEIERNPFNPNLHTAFLALLQNKRKLIEHLRS